MTHATSRDRYIGLEREVPSFVDLASSVLNQAVLPFKPFGALNAVPLSQSWQIFGCLRALVLGQVFRRVQVGVYLI